MQKHKHDWQQTGEVRVPTGQHMYSVSYNGGKETPFNPVTFNALVFICRDCEKIKIKKIEDLKELY